MKNCIILICLLYSALCFSQEPSNYKPDNQSVRIESTNLPIVFISTNNQQIDREDRITARMKIIYNGANQLTHGDTIAYPNQTIDYDGYIGLKYRGNSSFTNSDKKPYAIRPLNKPLEEGGKKQKVSILGMGVDDDWALLAPYADKSMIRDLLSFTLARPYFEFVPSGKHCEMIMDGVYYGVFIMSERVRKGSNRLNIGKPSADTGDDLTGGYHLEVDRDDETVYKSKYAPVDKNGNAISGKSISYQYKSPEFADLTEAQLNYIHSYIDAMENALASEGYKDPINGYRKYMDVTSFIDYMLSTELAHNVDGYRLSTNIYKHKDSVDPRFKTSLWDLNLGFGNANYYDGWKTDTWVYNYNDQFSHDSQIVPFWWHRLLTDEAFNNEVKDRWAEYRLGNYSDQHIEDVIDSMTINLNAYGAQERNSTAWPRWGRHVWPNYYVANSYDEEISYLKDWISKRLAFMDLEILGIEPEKPAITTLNINSGFNADIIAEQFPTNSYTSESADGGDWVFMTNTLKDGAGLPIDGKIESANNIQYQLADYTQNNVLLMKDIDNGELRFDKSISTTKLYLLASSAQGSSDATVTIYYNDGSQHQANISIPDWYGDSTNGYGSMNRISRADDSIDARYKFNLYENSISTNASNEISKIGIQKNTSGYPMFFAVSAEDLNTSSTGVEQYIESLYSIYPSVLNRGESLFINTPEINHTIHLMSFDGLSISKTLTKNSQTIIDTTQLEKGIYIISIESLTETKRFKLIVK